MARIAGDVAGYIEEPYSHIWRPGAGDMGTNTATWSLMEP